MPHGATWGSTRAGPGAGGRAWVLTSAGSGVRGTCSALSGTWPWGDQPGLGMPIGQVRASGLCIGWSPQSRASEEKDRLKAVSGSLAAPQAVLRDVRLLPAPRRSPQPPLEEAARLSL